MWGGTTTRSQLQQSINSLWRVNEIPEAPTENSASFGIDPIRHLSFAREKEIVNNLAFLSATTDDSRRVMAVCIEESISGEGVTIRITSNTGDLSAVTAGFRRLAEVLERAARRENSRTKDTEALLREIVKLDISRILTRLRSRHVRSYKSVGKPALINQLCQAINDPSIKYRRGLSNASLEVNAERLKDLFTSLEVISDLKKEGSQAQELLSLIVRYAHELTLATDLSRVFQGAKLDPSLLKHLPIAISKLGRYYAAASELICAARDKQCPVFHKIQVESFHVNIPNSAHGIGLVHAEIQLLFFYEMHPGQPRPRVICSSKSACYLCNLFFGLHGEFNIPRSHGKLYNKWILPDWLDIPAERHKVFAAIITRFIAILENKVRQAPRSKKGCCHPNESVLFPLAHWPSSVTSRSLSIVSQSTPPRPQSTRVREANSVMPSLDKIPLTPPKTPSEKRDSFQSDIEISPCNIIIHKPSLLSMVIIGYNELPYSESITVATPPLHLRLDNLTIQFDFSRTSPCRLSITQAEDPTGGYHTVRVENIPTAAEMMLGCSSSNRLGFRLPIVGKEALCISFVWDV
ncbi:hypothetical protein MauCBS54593_004533 [Microsporum audouinii]